MLLSNMQWNPELYPDFIKLIESLHNVCVISCVYTAGKCLEDSPRASGRSLSADLLSTKKV